MLCNSTAPGSRLVRIQSKGLERFDRSSIDQELKWNFFFIFLIKWMISLFERQADSSTSSNYFAMQTSPRFGKLKLPLQK